MTVIDELLVLLDDEQSRTLDECGFLLPHRTRQTLSSTLGRLAAKGWVSAKRDRSSKELQYAISDGGQGVVTRTLNHLKLTSDEEWDGRWLFVFFNIPEKSRKYRDILRNRLMQVGFGRVQNSVWVTGRDVRFEIQDLLEHEQIRNATTVIRPVLEEEDARELVRSFVWEWAYLNAEYKRFIAQGKTFINSSVKDPFKAKLLVYHYAKLLSQDPKLPNHLEPSGYSRLEAHNTYLKIRPFCY